MKKVLIITYYWPPSGGGGVQRWVKMSKYLPDFGWEPIVFKPQNPEYPLIDHSFDEEVKSIKILECPIWEPSRFLKKIGAEKEANLSAGFVSEGKSWKQKFAIWVRSNFFIPDARKFWIKPSIKYLNEYLRENPVDAIISSGPPHSCHLIALPLKNEFNIPWIADFRDPWTNIDFYQELSLTTWADKKHHRLEEIVLKTADVVVPIGKTMGEELKDLGAKNVVVIPNGYDVKRETSKQMDAKFTLTHIGTLGKARNPMLLWKVLSEICSENLEFANDCHVQLMGSIDAAIKNSVQEFGLNSQVSYGGSVSNHIALDLQSKSQVLLLLINQSPNAKGILTGKFFEYLSVQRPILAIGPKDGDAAEMLNETQAGLLADYDQAALLKQHILAYYQLYKSGELNITTTGIEKYSRKNLTKILANLLNELTIK